MKDHKTEINHHCSVIEKRRLEFDMAYCDATYDSKEGRDRCYMEASETRVQRKSACKHAR